MFTIVHYRLIGCCIFLWQQWQIRRLCFGNRSRYGRQARSYLGHSVSSHMLSAWCDACAELSTLFKHNKYVTTFDITERQPLIEHFNWNLHSIFFIASNYFFHNYTWKMFGNLCAGLCYHKKKALDLVLPRCKIAVCNKLLRVFEKEIFLNSSYKLLELLESVFRIYIFKFVIDTFLCVALCGVLMQPF